MLAASVLQAASKMNPAMPPNGVYDESSADRAVSHGTSGFGNCLLPSVSPLPGSQKGSDRAATAAVIHRFGLVGPRVDASRLPVAPLRPASTASKLLVPCEAMAFLFADRPALLKDLDNDEARVIEYERVRDRWFAFTVPFSIAHGCVAVSYTHLTLPTILLV